MRYRKLKYSVISILLSSVVLITLHQSFDRFENQLYDQRFKDRYYGKSARGSIKDIVIVDIDTRSVNKLGKYFEWPRTYFAEAVDVLSKKECSLICFDMLFDKSSRSEEDSVFVSSVSKAGNVITGYNFEMEDSTSFIYADKESKSPGNIIKLKSTGSGFEDHDIMNIGSKELLSSSLSNGFLGIGSDGDGVIRKVPLLKKYKGDLYPSFALTVIMQLYDIKSEDTVLSDCGQLLLKKTGDNLLEQDIKIPLDSDNRMTVHYKGTWGTFRTISFYDVMKNRVGRKTFRDKPVLIGSSLRGLMDLRSTPVQRYLPGVEVQANIINTILSKGFIKVPGRSFTLLIMIILIILTAFIIISRLNIIFSTLLIIAAGYSYYLLTGYLFMKKDIYIDTTRPLIAVIFTFLVTYLISYYTENRSKKLIRSTLGKYVPEVVSQEMLKDPSKLKVGGEKKEISMLFSDIRSFTSYSEKTDPEELVSFLNIYLKRMTGVVKKNQGTLDKYMGDAIICFFGAPLEIDHPYLSCRAALAMMKELSELKTDLEKDTFKNIDIGIGINTDTVTVGNIGSDDLFDYTAIGDGMNLASRLEGLNKYYGTNILISGSTQEKVKERFIFRELDEVYVKGKDEPVKMFELLSEAGQQLPAEITEKCGNYSEALGLYKSGNFLKAREIFEYLIEKFQDRSSVLMADRCSHLEKFPQHDWKGVWKMDAK